MVRFGASAGFQEVVEGRFVSSADQGYGNEDGIFQRTFIVPKWVGLEKLEAKIGLHKIT